MKKQAHGQDGHLNIFTLDQDSRSTSFGKHDRLTSGVIIDCEYSSDFTVRVNNKWKLGDPTEAQIIGFMKHHEGVKGSFEIFLTETWDNQGETITDHYIRKV